MCFRKAHLIKNAAYNSEGLMCRTLEHPLVGAAELINRSDLPYSWTVVHTKKNPECDKTLKGSASSLSFRCHSLSPFLCGTVFKARFWALFCLVDTFDNNPLVNRLKPTRVCFIKM